MRCWALAAPLQLCILAGVAVHAQIQRVTAFSPSPQLELPRPRRRIFLQSEKPVARAVRGGLHATSDPLTLGFLAGCALAAVGSVRRRRTRSAIARVSRGAHEACRLPLKATAATAEHGPTLKLFSPAKINLFLRITQRRPDGYHDLASLFHTVSFGDTLDLELLPTSAERDELECNIPGVPLDDSNLVIRALQLFRDRSGVQRHFRVRLEKCTPTQAGMGGGSSNAATAFFGANALCGSPGSEADLLRWANDPVIGSDASFFLSEGTAFCTGRGEIVTPVPPLPLQDGLSVYLVKPRYGLSTPKVFKALDLNTLSTAVPEELLQKFQEHGMAHGHWINDLERPAFEVCPELGKLKAFLADKEWGFQAVLMSGSGTTIFCLGEPRGGAAAVEAAALARGFDLEGFWRTSLLRRESGDKWYSAPEAST